MLIENQVTKTAAEVDNILRKNFGKQLFYPKHDDQIRLLRLVMWTERYKVSLTYILGVLIPHFERMANKHRGRARGAVSKGIGTTIANLTGQASEQLLTERIAKDFPDGEHIIAWKQERQRECFDKLNSEDGDGELSVRRPKNILKYPTLGHYVRAYTERMQSRRSSEDRLIKKLAKQPWRGNPFR